MRLCLLLPGQGLQTAGVLQPLMEKFPAIVKGVLAEVEQVLPDCNLGSALVDPEYQGDIVTTDIAQPMTLAASVAAWRALSSQLSQKHPTSRVTQIAGHSLGEYSALTVAGALPLADALKLVRARGLAMKQAGNDAAARIGGPTGMRLMFRPKQLPPTDFAKLVSEVCTEVSGREPNHTVAIAAWNSADQILLSGSYQALDGAETLAKHKAGPAGRRMRVRPLAVSAAFHSPYMQPAVADLQTRVEHAKWTWPPAYSVISNRTALPLESVDQLKQLLPAALTEPIRWTESIAYVEDHVDAFLSILPGRVGAWTAQKHSRKPTFYYDDSADCPELEVAA